MTQTDCPECSKAARARWHGMYRRGCFGCEMRGFARSRLATDAIKDRSTAALREALSKSHPNTPAQVALDAIWAWWKADHPQEVKA